MKSLILAAVLFLPVGHLPAAATAYQALQHLAASRGSQALDDVFVVRGEGGGPQPEEWIVFRGRTNAPVFQATGIKASGVFLTGSASARTVGLQPHAQPINFSVLNLDSNSAWRVAQRAARKENFQFDRVDYELKTNPLVGSPAWTLRLFNEKKSYLGEITVSGATGEILHPLRLSRYVVDDIDGEPTLATVQEPWAKRALRSVGHWFNRTGSTFGHDMLRAAGTAEEIVIGRRTRDYTEDVE
jgi:hypothetical protein